MEAIEVTPIKVMLLIEGLLTLLLLLCLALRYGADQYLVTLSKSHEITSNREVRWANVVYECAWAYTCIVATALVGWTLGVIACQAITDLWPTYFN
jgi:hypothetical protein